MFYYERVGRETFINSEAIFFCRHCEKEVVSVWIIKINSIIGTRYVLLCPDCQKLIGIYSSIEFIESINNTNIIFDELQVLFN